MLKRFKAYMDQYSVLKPYYRSFGFKLFFFIGIALILLVGMNTWYNIHVQEQQLNEEVLIGMGNIAQTVRYSTRIHMLENQKEKVQETINYIAKRTEGIESIRIFDKKGAIRKTTIPGERGRLLDITSEECSACHIKDVSIEVPQSNRHIRITPSAKGEYRQVTLTNAIYNEDGCYLNCHTIHPKDQSVLGVFEVTMSLKDVDGKIAGNRRHLILFSIISFIVIMTGLGAMLFYSLIRPMNALLTGIKSISLGNFLAEIPVYSKDEFGRLAHSLNNMVEKLRKEVAYRNLLLYDSIVPERQIQQETDDENVTCKIERSGALVQNGLGSTFEEIYDRIGDETHLKLVRSVKLASLGQLSAGIAHEINNPLTAVLSYSSLLLEKAQNPKEKQWLTIIVDETKRCRNIVAGLLEFARQSTPEKVITQVNDIIDRAISLVENKESFHNITIKKELDTSLPKVKLDRGQIYQVLTNLIINAGDAMEGKGTLTVGSRIYTITSNVADDRHYVEVSISDTGCGIPEQNMERLFDPFFTTKGPTIGTGLGLSICFGIIKRHNGNITVNSKIGEGSTFVIHLPVEKENGDEQD